MPLLSSISKAISRRCSSVHMLTRQAVGMLLLLLLLVAPGAVWTELQ
jgi:hypothetical protein